MGISIHFFGAQRTITGTDSIKMPLSGKAKVADAFEYISINYPDLKLDRRMVLAIVNQDVVTLETELRDNDKLSFVPHIGGG